jgi:tetratricopeptide (TPR) repeat protein
MRSGERGLGRRVVIGSHQAGIAQLARARAFQARGRGFESRFPLHRFPRSDGHGFRIARRVPRLRRRWWIRLQSSWALAGLLVAGGLAVAAEATSPEAFRLNEAAAVEVGHGRPEAALDLLTRAVSLDPRDPSIRSNLARVRTIVGQSLAQSGRFREAEVQYRAALDADPAEMSAWLSLGGLQLRQREARAAEDTFRRAIGVDPGNADAAIGLGDAYYTQGDLIRALAEWERALAMRPEDSALRDRIAGVQREAKVHTGYRSRESQHFQVVYEGRRQEDIGRELIAILERAYNDVGYALGAYPDRAVPTIFYSDRDFAEATGRSSRVGGYYHLLDGKIRIALRGLRPQDPALESLLYHEYTHALIYAVTRGNNPPRWVHEGLAVHLERRRAPQFREEALRGARAGQSETLDRSPYVMGSVAVEYLLDRYGMATMRLLLQRLGDGTPFPQAFQETFRMDLAALERTLQDVVTRGY